MGLKIRMRQQGRHNHATYRVVVTDARTKRDGKYVEALGWYNPMATQEDMLVLLKADRIQHWLDLGAEPSERVCNLLAKVAPDVMRKYTQKAVVLRAKMAEKRKARNKAAAK